jgi:hypothetical protein
MLYRCSNTPTRQAHSRTPPRLSRSPIKISRPNIHHITRLENYHETAKLNLNENNMKNINTSLMLQEATYRNLKLRIEKD